VTFSEALDVLDEKDTAATENGETRWWNAQQKRGEGGGEEMEDAGDDNDGSGQPL
jgi:hypothetical protein